MSTPSPSQALSSLTPAPLSLNAFYVLITLIDEPLHIYGIRQRIMEHSLHSRDLKDGYLYPLISRLIASGLVADIGQKRSMYTESDRIHYALTGKGKRALKAELLRWRHAVRVAETAGYFNDELPLDIQAMLEQFTGRSITKLEDV